jgi:hypothetical protein
MMAVQAVDEKLRAITAKIDAAAEDDDDVSDLEYELMSYEKAAQELRIAYEAAVKMASNLPAYDKLVK